MTTTMLDPRLHAPLSEPGTDLWVDPPVDVTAGPLHAPGSFDALVADCAEVTRHLAEVPRDRVVAIPARAVAMVAHLDLYGD